MTINVLVFIHGITPQERPRAHESLYESFWHALLISRPELDHVITEVVHVEWGNHLGEASRPDTRLSEAQRRISDLVRYDRVRSHANELNQVHPGPLGDWNLVLGLRPMLRLIRQELVQFGLADAIYYASAEGECAVRVAIYGQVLEALRPHRDAADVRVHIVAHSLGVTVSHDFLFGLFGKTTEPDFLKQATKQEDRDDYSHWRKKASDGSLRLGSFVSMASQLPMFVLRKQALVDRLAAGDTLDPSIIGLTGDEVRWLILYDVDDVLGFATRELYGNAPMIRQIQVDSGDTPICAHTDYWKNMQTIEEVATLLARNTA